MSRPEFKTQNREGKKDGQRSYLTLSKELKKELDKTSRSTGHSAGLLMNLAIRKYLSFNNFECCNNCNARLLAYDSLNAEDAGSWQITCNSCGHEHYFEIDTFLLICEDKGGQSYVFGDDERFHKPNEKFKPKLFPTHRAVVSEAYVQSQIGWDSYFSENGSKDRKAIWFPE